jgi:pyrroloquinoline-quinone synthase
MGKKGLDNNDDTSTMVSTDSMLTSSTDISEMLATLEHDMAAHPILTHPFLIRLSDGCLSRDQIRAWIGQQFHFSRQFPRCLACLYARIDDFEVSAPLMSFLAVEHWGSSEAGAHWQMFKQVIEFFGYDLRDLKAEQPFPETTEYLAYRLNLCATGTVEEGLGALGFGHEFVNAFIFASYLKGVKQVPGIGDDTLQYFKAHVDDEPEDYQVFKRMTLATVKDAGGVALVRKGAEDVLRARTIFFDRLDRHLR